MKILLFSFYYKMNIEVHPGIAVLSSALKKRGHETKLQPYFYLDKVSFSKTIKDFQPDVIGISATSMAAKQVERLVGYLKEITDVPITLGGVFCILEPEKALAIEGIDAICIGEGTEGIVEYVEGRHPATNYVYKDGRRGAVQKWSSQPICNIDYDIFYDAMPKEEISKKLDYWTCYTCEYSCAFCSSAKFRNLVGLKNKPRVGVEMAIDQLEKMVQKTGCKKIHFRDPLFLGVKERDWVEHFLKLYKERINLQYTCNMRADSLDETMVDLLKESGCHTIKMGLESGDEYMRNHILNKGQLDADYEKACAYINDREIRLSLNAMIGLPYETVETANKTVEMLLKLGSKKSFLHVFQPWPGLDLPTEINSRIKYIESPALYDPVVQGRKSDDFMQGISYDKEAVSRETIEFPVLDQPQFSYELAIEMQEKFQNQLAGKIYENRI